MLLTVYQVFQDLTAIYHVDLEAFWKRSYPELEQEGQLACPVSQAIPFTVSCTAVIPIGLLGSHQQNWWHKSKGSGEGCAGQGWGFGSNLCWPGQSHPPLPWPALPWVCPSLALICPSLSYPTLPRGPPSADFTFPAQVWELVWGDQKLVSTQGALRIALKKRDCDGKCVQKFHILLHIYRETIF